MIDRNGRVFVGAAWRGDSTFGDTRLSRTQTRESFERVT